LGAREATRFVRKDGFGVTTHETARRYPLSWPTGWKRTPAHERQRADFGKTTVQTYTERHYDGRPDETKTRKRKAALTAADAAIRLEAELDRLGAENAKLSTSQKLRMDGTPRSDLSEPADVGAAVYFTLDGKPRCLACDRWTRVADNIAALAQHIDALRRIERYGVGTMEQAFAGYAALPPTSADWAIVLGVSATATREQIIAAHRKLATEHHPDKGGRLEDMARINQARDLALKTVLR
jgi:hypothetical protein